MIKIIKYCNYNINNQIVIYVYKILNVYNLNVIINVNNNYVNNV